MINAVGIISILAVLISIAYAADPVCSKQALCTCETPQGTIDMTPLSSKVFSCNDAKGLETFLYSPCSDNKTMPCLNAMVCKRTLVDHVSIGKSSGETFINKDGKVAIEYPGEDNKTSTVILKCDQDTEGDLNMISESGDEFVFQFASSYACVGGPSTKTTPKTTKTSSKTTKTSPKTTKTSPKTTKTSPKTTKTSPKTTKTSPETTKTSPKTTKTSPKSTKTTPKNTKTTPKNTKTTPKNTKTTPKNTKTTPKSSKTTPHITSTHKYPTTTHNGAPSNCSIKMAFLSVLLLACRQLLF